MLSQLQLNRLVWKVLDEIYPPACVSCGTTGDRWCSECLATIRIFNESEICPLCGIPQNIPVICEECMQNPPKFNAARSWGYYAGTLKEAIQALKYRSDLGLAELLAKPMIKMITDFAWNIDIIVPVPIGKHRLRTRGYNQAGMLAKWIALELSLPLTEKAILRTKETQSQVGLKADERRENLRGAFVSVPELVRGKSVLLVDDVITTCTTMRACSQALTAAGVKTVCGISAARAGHYDLN